MSAFAQAQQDSTKKITTGIFSNPKLQPYRQQANEYYASFKNRYALEELKKMDAAADTLAASELKRLENDLRQKQQAETGDQAAKIGEQNNLIKSLTEQNEILCSERNKMWRKAIFSILIWLIIVALYIIYKMKMFSGINKTLSESKETLTRVERFHEKGERLAGKIASDEIVLSKAGKIAEQLTAVLKQPSNVNVEASEELMQLIESVNKMIAMNGKLMLLMKDVSDEKKTVDVNSLCEQMVLFGSNGIETEDGVYHFTITKDFEKRLPLVKANEQGLGRVLLFLMSNALNACYRHSSSGLKGYQPKITVSTRVLPRFVQVKVKDNGAGLNDEVLEEAYDPFFTTWIGKKAGIGLTLCKKIIEENKGEMKIESSLDRGTDVTVKLFL